MTSLRALLVLVLAFTLSACGGADPKPAAEKDPGPPATEPREYARALAGPGQNLRDSYTSWDQDCAAGIALACGLGPISLSASAETLAISLELATREGHADYLGRLAAEDQALFDDTVADAEAMKAAAKKLTDAGCNMVVKPTADCLQIEGEVDAAWSRLAFDLDGWAKHA